MADYRRIGEILLRKGKLTQEQLDTAVAARMGQRRRLGRMLTSLGFVSDKDIAECLGEQYGLDVIDPRKLTPDREALGLLGGDFALERRILPLRFSEECLECVIADPIDFPTTDMIARMAGRRTVFYLSPESALVASIQAAYGLASARPGNTEHRHRTPRPVVLKPAKDRDAILARLDLMLSRTV
jgi:hypothetical protein